MQNIRAQRGASFFSWLVILVLIAFFASAAFKLIPHYMDNKALEKAILAVEEDKATGDKIDTVGDFYNHISKSMQVNSIRDLKMDDIIEVTQNNNDFLVHLKYEKRESLIKNIDLVVTFDKEYRVRAK
ncbi:DUF4845 domain-containing protein [Pseudomonas sp. C27(2019)]|uniref:DUF4845 domain-containing protein n=1 Tax=Pseudomonas sp. C27(2019) TaxID=2604941 RepID=UPI0012444996|nr:DUF4845 domain-containing protein [Pseudomonas sp. C27(2019)]QEY58983.1 DUF4845 domain-containing protein [Pseudomonas sp. C27(2019)]